MAADISYAPSPIENIVEQLCQQLLKKSNEFWEDRNKAILDLTVKCYQKISYM